MHDMTLIALNTNLEVGLKKVYYGIFVTAIFSNHGQIIYP